MIVCAAGDAHGALDELYSNVASFAAKLGIKFDYVLHVGDFGIWPDLATVDRATRDHDGAGDFPRWFAENKTAPHPTIFIKGNHEDFEWLSKLGGKQALPQLTYLPNGETIALDDRFRVGGIGGCFGPSNFERPSTELRGYARRHFTRDEIAKLCSAPKIDILLLHDAPDNVELAKPIGHGQERRYKSTAIGLADAIAQIQPRVCFFGHHHVRLDAEVAGVRCIGLNKVGCPGNLVAIEICDSIEDGWKKLGEF